MSLIHKKQEPLSKHTTFHIGGPAEYFCTVRTREELEEVVVWARESNLPVTILGGGSNVLVSDAGIAGLVIKNGIGGISYDEHSEAVEVTAGAGVVFDALVAELVQKNIWGLENLSGIPGLVGAVPIQNVGAYGVEVSERISSVVLYDMEQNTYVPFDNAACQFAYRNSVFKKENHKKYVVVSVVFSLSKTPKPKLHYKDLASFFEGDTDVAIRAIRKAVLEIRSKKFPDWTKVGTAGSFFKNPIIAKETYDALLKEYPDMPGFPDGNGMVKIPLGWILEWGLQLKGYREGRVGTYEGQSLVLINHGGATEQEVIKFAHHIETKVKDATDIDIEWEVTHVC
jgi:UDP-N-acetylmuramate dehydrogenase